MSRLDVKGIPPPSISSREGIPVETLRTEDDEGEGRIPDDTPESEVAAFRLKDIERTVPGARATTCKLELSLLEIYWQYDYKYKPSASIASPSPDPGLSQSQLQSQSESVGLAASISICI